MTIIRGQNLRSILLTLEEIEHKDLTDYEFRLYCEVVWRIENGLEVTDPEWPEKDDRERVGVAVKKLIRLNLLEVV